MSDVMRRAVVLPDGRRLSYRRFGDGTNALVAVHGHLSEGAVFADLAARLVPDWQVIAPDQRGHGDSDRADDYSLDGYVGDLEALLSQLCTGPVAVLGHSMGALTAISLAAHRPELVTALIAVEASVENPGDAGLDLLNHVGALPYTASSPDVLVEAAGPLGAMLAPFLRRTSTDDGQVLWRLPFHPGDTVDSELALRVDHWDAWTASSMPALVIRGHESPALTHELAVRMVQARSGAMLAELDGDHFLHLQNPQSFATEVAEFLSRQVH